MQLLHTQLKALLLVITLLTPLSAERVVLVLSGGGARGLSHIGVLKALEKQNIKPDLIVGTSMGAIVGGLYSCGLTADEIDTLLHKGNLPELLTAESDRRFIPMQEKSHRPQSVLSFTLTKELKFSPIRGLLDGQIIYNLLSPTTLQAQMHAGNIFDSLTIPLRLITTNIETGEVVIHSEGDLLKVIKASSTIPGAFPPVNINGGLHVDGGIKANIPIIEEFLRSDDIIIAVDATSPLATADKLNNPIDIILQITGISMMAKEEESRRNATILIQPNLKGISNTDFDSSRAIITAGEKICENHSALKLLAEVPNADSVQKEHVHPSFTTLEIIGNNKTKAGYIKRSTAFTENVPLDDYIVQNSVKSLYGTDLFENIHVSGSHDTLRIQVEEQNRAKLSFGLRVDEYHLAEIFVLPSFYNIFGVGINSDLYFQLGYIRKQLRASLSGNVPFSNLHSLHYDLSAYLSSERVINRAVIDTVDSLPAIIEYSEFDLSKNGFNLSFGWDINKVVSLIGGARFERYSLRQSNNSSTDLEFATKNTQRTFYAGAEADYLDEYYFPQKGGNHQLWFSGASENLGSVQNFFTFNGSNRFIIPVNERNTFLPSIHYSWSDQPLPATSKYYLGGGRRQNLYTPATLFYAIPMAGIREHALPADMFLLATLQYRHRFGVNSRFYGSLYMDWGYAWDSVDGLTIGKAFEDYFRNAPLSLEVEAAVKTIVGPIKVSWSRIVAGSYPDKFNIKEESLFRISVGYNF